MPEVWWRAFLLTRLRDDPDFAADYLKAARESGDAVIYESALLDIEQALKGGWSGDTLAG